MIVKSQKKELISRRPTAEQKAKTRQQIMKELRIAEVINKARADTISYRVV